MAPAPPMGFNVPAGVPPPRIASSNPDQMVNTGLANNFNGRVVSIWLLPRKYKTGKKANTYSMFAEVNIKADDTSLGKDGLVTEYYNVSALNQWVPSRTDPVWNGAQWVYTPSGGTLEQYMSLHTGAAGFPVPNGQPGETSVMPPDDWRGWFAIPGAQNSQDGFGKGTKWEQFTNELKRAGYEGKAPHISWGDMRQFLVGVYGHWVRLPFEFKGGQAPAAAPGEQEVGKIDTLCLAEILDLGPISGNGGPVASSTVQVAVPAMPTSAPAAAPASAALTQAPEAVAAPADAVAGDDTPAGIDPAVAVATNEILTALAAQRGAAGLSKADAGVLVFAQVNERKLNGAMGLLLLNNPAWLEGDNRTFGYVPEKALIVSL